MNTKLKGIILIIQLLSSILIFNSCTKSTLIEPELSIVGFWQISLYRETVNGKTSSEIVGRPVDYFEITENTITSRLNGVSTNLNYVILEKNKQIQVSNSKGTILNLEIRNLTATTLTLYYENTSSSGVYVGYWELKK